MAQVVGWLAASLGYTLRALVVMVRAAPAFVGPACIVVSLWFVDWRLGLASVGVALLLLDRRI
jgi:hypothetical protein